MDYAVNEVTDIIDAVPLVQNCIEFLSLILILITHELYFQFNNYQLLIKSGLYKSL